jgi:uncharacterized protein YdeI (YjbR/CyaY-like superfamily)
LPTPRNVIFFQAPAELRAWFETNHETATELWLGYHRKRSGRATVTWQEVVDQELCFGWIDSVRYSLGDDMSAQRITPRRKGSVWSAVNIRRYRELEEQGLVHPRGRSAFEARDEARSRIYAYENRDVGLDPAREAKFRLRRRAWKFFDGQAPWYCRTASYWVMSAKRDETKDRRLDTLIECSNNGERIPHLRRPG